jgi:hypothetical protein
MKSQEKNLKKLILLHCNFGFLGDLKDLRLEHLEYSQSRPVDKLLEFLRHQVVLFSYSECDLGAEEFGESGTVLWQNQRL